MSKVQMLRALVKQRLTAAAEDIFGLFERTIAEYEETLCRSKEENERQRRLLDAVFNPQLRLHRADVQQLLVNEEEVPTEQQQDWSPSLDQEDPEPPHIKEEQEEVWTSQEGEQLHRQEEAEITKFTFTPVPEKSEDDDEEKPQSSQLHQRQTEQMETEADGEDCGGPEPDRNSHPERHEDSSEPETDDSDGDLKETRGTQSGLKSKSDVPVGDVGCKTNKNCCSECGKIYSQKSSLKIHMRTHTGVKPFSCPKCGKRFWRNGYLVTHMRIHTGEKPFSCSECGKRLSNKGNLTRHMKSHTGEKLFSCSVCSRRLSNKGSLKRHMIIHADDKPFSCSECGKRFITEESLKTHMRFHTGEKPFRCSVCGRGFMHGQYLSHHMARHKKRFSCSLCNRRFTWLYQFNDHQCAGHQSSQLHQRQTDQMETEADGEDCGGPEPDRNSHPDTHLTPENKVEDGDDDSRTQSGLNSLKNNEVPSLSVIKHFAECAQ